MDIRPAEMRAKIITIDLLEPVNALPPGRQSPDALASRLQRVGTDYPESLGSPRQGIRSQDHLQVPARPLETEARPPFAAHLRVPTDQRRPRPSAPPPSPPTKRLARPAEFYIPSSSPSPSPPSMATLALPRETHRPDDVTAQLFSPSPFSHRYQPDGGDHYKGA